MHRVLWMPKKGILFSLGSLEETSSTRYLTWILQAKEDIRQKRCARKAIAGVTDKDRAWKKKKKDRAWRWHGSSEEGMLVHNVWGWKGKNLNWENQHDHFREAPNAVPEGWGFRPQAEGRQREGRRRPPQDTAFLQNMQWPGRPCLGRVSSSPQPNPYLRYDHMQLVPLLNSVFSTSKDVLIEKVSAQWRAFI